VSFKKRNLRRHDPPRSIAELLAKLYPGKESAAELKVFAWWNRSVPARIRKNACPIRIRRGELLVHAATSAWANELGFMHDEFLSSLRKEAPGASILHIRFRVGPLPQTDTLEESAEEAPLIPPTEVTEEVARELARFRDDEVREAVGYAAAQSLAKAAREE